eukprot:5801504-Pleurochrysis_carterae.AAC.1
MANNGQGRQGKISDLKTASFLLVVPPEIIHRRILDSAATRRDQSDPMVQIHRNRAFMRGRASHWLPRFPENLPPA